MGLGKELFRGWLYFEHTRYAYRVHFREDVHFSESNRYRDDPMTLETNGGNLQSQSFKKTTLADNATDLFYKIGVINRIGNIINYIGRL